MSLAQKIEALREKLGVETGSSWPFIIECGFRFMGLVPEPGAAAPALVEQLVLVRLGGDGEFAWVLLEAVGEAGPSGA